MIRSAAGRSSIAAAISPNGSLYYVLYALMIFFFSYFWVATTFQPAQIADDLKKYGGYIPGVRPGKPTADFLDFTMTRLTFAGAIFLTVIAILPQLLSHQLGVPCSSPLPSLAAPASSSSSASCSTRCARLRRTSSAALRRLPAQGPPPGRL